MFIIRLLAITVSIVIVVFLADWVLSVPVSCYSGETGQQTAAEQSCAPFQGALFSWAKPAATKIGTVFEAHQGITTAFSTLVIALFTIALAWATAGLFAVAKKQAQHTAKSLEIAGKALEAATKQADAAAGASAPYLYPRVVAFDLYPSTVKISKDATHHPSVTLAFENIGRSPAVLRRIWAELVLMPQGEAPPAPMKVLEGVENFDAIAPGDRGGQKEWEFDRDITANEIRDLKANNNSGTFARFFLLGFVVFEDVFNVEHTSHFCVKVMQHGSQRLAGGRRLNYGEREDAANYKNEA